jgi:hypothetical protein
MPARHAFFIAFAYNPSPQCARKSCTACGNTFALVLPKKLIKPEIGGVK